MKKFLNEFKEFAMKGNVLDMAIGVVIGASFSSIVTSLVNDIFMPLIAVLTGDVQFFDLKLVLKGDISINYGSFIQNIVNFLIVALCLFLVVKAINELRKTLIHEKPKEKEEPKPSDELVALNKIVELLEDKK